MATSMMRRSLFRLVHSYTQENTSVFHQARGVSWFGKKKEPKEESSLAVEKNDVNDDFEVTGNVYEEQPPDPPSKEYFPSPNILPMIEDSVKTCLGVEEVVDLEKISLSDNYIKHKILNDCYTNFKFAVPNSDLSSLKTIGDVIHFYSQRYEDKDKTTVFKQPDLPRNLQINLEPIRFTASTKDFFKGGKTAFPGRDTVITSLKYRHIYDAYKNPKTYKRKQGFDYTDD